LPVWKLLQKKGLHDVDSGVPTGGTPRLIPIERGDDSHVVANGMGDPKQTLEADIICGAV
jgi:hypothetical protein